jgi:hypothetical protein
VLHSCVQTKKKRFYPLSIVKEKLLLFFFKEITNTIEIIIHNYEILDLKLDKSIRFKRDQTLMDSFNLQKISIEQILFCMMFGDKKLF